MRKVKILALLAVILSATSCKKSDPAPAPAEKFMSLTTGSTWIFKSTNNTTATPTVTNYTLTASNTDTTINGRSYKKLNNSNGNNEYYNITGSDYYKYGQLPGALADTYAELLYLKDNASVGTEWTQSIPATIGGLPITVIIKSRIAQKGIAKTVNSIAYSDVIDVESSITASGIPPFITYTLTSNFHEYYAPKVGLIESQYKLDLTVNPVVGVPAIPPVKVDLKTELQSANIL